MTPHNTHLREQTRRQPRQRRPFDPARARLKASPASAPKLVRKPRLHPIHLRCRPRSEDLHDIAVLKDDLLCRHKPVNSQELFAVSGFALAQQASPPRRPSSNPALSATCLNENARFRRARP